MAVRKQPPKPPYEQPRPKDLEFAHLLKRLRAEKRWTTRELSAATGGKVAHATISAVENGTRKPVQDPEKLRALATAFGDLTTFEELASAAGYRRPTVTRSDDRVVAGALAARGTLSDRAIDEVLALVHELEAGKAPKKPRRAAK